VRSEGFYVNEKCNDTSWDPPATFRFVAQHLNHCVTAVPGVCKVNIKYKTQPEQSEVRNAVLSLRYEG